MRPYLAVQAATGRSGVAALGVAQETPVGFQNSAGGAELHCQEAG
jgi:hypothetical protein